MDERDLLNAWRMIFQADGVNDKSLAKADELLEDSSGESPLHLRLTQELAELKKRHGSVSRK